MTQESLRELLARARAPERERFGRPRVAPAAGTVMRDIERALAPGTQTRRPGSGSAVHAPRTGIPGGEFEAGHPGSPTAGQLIDALGRPESS